MTIYEISKFRKNRGFTMIELMLVMAIAAVMMSLKMQDDQLEMTQLQARKLGGTELFVYNLGVQKYISKLSGIVPAPAAYPQVYTGVNWLKSDECPSTPPPADPANPTPHHVPCSFLQTSGGRTTMGAMSFTTTIDYDSATGYTARTVLSQMAGTAANENNSGVLGMAALVASGAFIGSDASATSGGSGGSIIYCPDINPMPVNMGATCGVARDQIVMIVNTNGNDDQWLRVDHGNMMRHVIEMSEDVNATPALDSDLDTIHPNMRQIRNVARIYNMGASGNENIYIGRRLGSTAEVTESGSPTTLASNAVIIDADQEILGRLIVQGDIDAVGGNITATGTGPGAGNINADNNIESLNGWIRATNGNIIADAGDVRANSGNMYSERYYDVQDSSFYVDSNQTSRMNTVEANNVNALNSTLNTNANTVNMTQNLLRIDSSAGFSNTILQGGIDVTAGTIRIEKNGTYYPIEDLIPNMTYLGSRIATHGNGYAITIPSAWRSQCGNSSRLKIYATSMSNSIFTEDQGGNKNYGRIGRWVTQAGWTVRYYQRSLYDFDGGFGGGYDNGARATLQFYCAR